MKLLKYQLSCSGNENRKPESQTTRKPEACSENSPRELEPACLHAYIAARMAALPGIFSSLCVRIAHVCYGYIVVLLLIVLNLSGCALGVRSEHDPVSDSQVIALSSSRDVIALSADDIVRVMRRAGFSDEQILELGTGLRNALASSGAAQIQVEEVVEAIFAVRGHYLHVSSYRRGSFIFDVETSEIR